MHGRGARLCSAARDETGDPVCEFKLSAVDTRNKSKVGRMQPDLRLCVLLLTKFSLYFSTQISKMESSSCLYVIVPHGWQRIVEGSRIVYVR